MPDVDDAQKFLAQAELLQKDTQLLVASNSCSEILYGWTLQRSTELALKAWMRLLDIVTPKHHDLGRLFDALAEKDPDSAKHRILAKHTRHVVIPVYGDIGRGKEAIDRQAEAQRVALLVQDVKKRLHLAKQTI